MSIRRPLPSQHAKKLPDDLGLAIDEQIDFELIHSMELKPMSPDEALGSSMPSGGLDIAELKQASIDNNQKRGSDAQRPRRSAKKKKRSATTRKKRSAELAVYRPIQPQEYPRKLLVCLDNLRQAEFAEDLPDKCQDLLRCMLGPSFQKSSIPKFVGVPKQSLCLAQR